MGKVRHEWPLSFEIMDKNFGQDRIHSVPGVGQFYQIIEGCGLSPREKEVLELIFAMSMSYSAAAKYIGISKGVAQCYYKRAIKKLKNKYDNNALQQ